MLDSLGKVRHDFPGCPATSLVHILVVWPQHASLPYYARSLSCLLSFTCTKLFRIPPNSPMSSQTLSKCSRYLLTIGRAVEGSPISLLPKGWLREPSKSYHSLFPSVLHLFYNILIVGCQTSSLTRP